MLETDIRDISLKELFNFITIAYKYGNRNKLCSLYGMYKARGGKRSIDIVDCGDDTMLSLYLAYRAFYSTYIGFKVGTDFVKISEYPTALSNFYLNNEVHDILYNLRGIAYNSVRHSIDNSFCNTNSTASDKAILHLYLSNSFEVCFNISKSCKKSVVVPIVGSSFSHSCALYSSLTGKAINAELFVKHLVYSLPVFA